MRASPFAEFDDEAKQKGEALRQRVAAFEGTSTKSNPGATLRCDFRDCGASEPVDLEACGGDVNQCRPLGWTSYESSEIIKSPGPQTIQFLDFCPLHDPKQPVLRHLVTLLQALDSRSSANAALHVLPLTHLQLLESLSLVALEDAHGNPSLTNHGWQAVQASKPNNQASDFYHRDDLPTADAAAVAAAYDEVLDVHNQALAEQANETPDVS